jgi:hypothetical protein
VQGVKKNMYYIQHTDEDYLSTACMGEKNYRIYITAWRKNEYIT